MKSLVCCAVLGACFAALRPAPADADALLEADRAFHAETTTDGLEGWLRWFAPDAVMPVASGATLRGADERRAWYSSIGFPPPGFHWQPHSAALAESGELGYTIGSWELRPPGDQAAEDTEAPGGSYLTIWQRQADGSYLVLSDAGGQTDFRTRSETVPDSWSCTTDWSAQAASGEYRFILGSWNSHSGEVSRQGRCITIWKRTGTGAWEIETETGFEF